MKDFFISYNKADKSWAEWIAWTLEESGYSVVIQAWDFRPGGNFVLKMHEAASDTDKTIAVLSESYLNAEYTQPEWAAAFTRDPKGKDRALIPIRVEQCAAGGLLSSIIHIDLVGHSAEKAREAILEGLKQRGKPSEAPTFPGSPEQTNIEISERVAPHPVQFPGSISANSSPEEQPSENPWNVPQGVPFFTGREEVLGKLRQALIEGKAAVLAQRQAISGLGGIGKTQTAIAYAARHRSDYAAVLWAVAESRESLMSDFVAIANVLNLPERNIQDQNFVVSAVKRWFEATPDWLLILDNADEPRLAEEFLPSRSNGHIVLTSRAQVFDSIGILNPIEMEEMSPADAREFLLKRTGRHDLEPDEAIAIEQLASELDYLPLALEQAGAYIKELRSSFQDYLVSYRARGLELLEKGAAAGKDRKSVRTTWSLNFQQVEETSNAAADLLRVSAFLGPDRIPNELFTIGAGSLGSELSSSLANVDSDPLALDEVLKPLIRYSLIHRDRKSKTYDIHRLVQVVLKEGLNDAEKRVWAERTVNAVDRALPEVDLNDPSMWNRVERVLPHAQVCSETIKTWDLESLEAAQLVNNLGRYLHFRARLSEAGLHYESSLRMREKLLGGDHGDVASSLHNQGWLLSNQGKYAEAEELYLRSLAIRERTLSPNSVAIASTLALLGRLYLDMGRYEEADAASTRSLKIRNSVLGEEHPDVIEIFILQAVIFLGLDNDDEAEPLSLHSLKITENTLGKEHPRVSVILDSLAQIYYRKGRFEEAETLYLRSQRIGENAYGANYPSVAVTLNNLAHLYTRMGKYVEAESLIAKAQGIREKVLGRKHPSIADSLIALAELRGAQGLYEEAETLYKQALSLKQSVLGTENLLVARILCDLAGLYDSWHKPFKGDPLVRRAISIQKKMLGPEHPRVIDTMSIHARLLIHMNRKGEAQRIESQVRRIQAKRHRKSKKTK